MHKIVLTNFVLIIKRHCLNKGNAKAVFASLDYRENIVFQQTFSRNSESLKKEYATTLKALRILINKSYSPNPSTVYADNIYDMKSWIRPYVSTFQHHGSPHVFRFTKNVKGEVEMVYRLLAGDVQKEWLPKGKPFVIMKDAPPGYPAILKPENAKNVTPDVMERALNHLTSRLTGADIEWWRSFIAREREKRRMWEEMTEDEYMEAGESFDISPLRSKPLSSDQDDEDDEDMLRAEAVILRQLNKEHRPVRNVKS